MPFLSIIMPVYCAEQTLDRAIQSILRQSFSDFEIIAVDDCSPDNCGIMLDQYAKKDSRIHVIHQPKNGGASAAKNAALSKISGTYFTVVDSDDWIEQDMVERYFYAAQSYNYDVILSGYYQDNEDINGQLLRTISVPSFVKFLKTKTDVINFLSCLDEKKLFAYNWNKIYKSTLLQNGNHRPSFFENMKYSEDLIFNLQIFQYVSSMACLDGSFYHYIKTPRESLSNKPIANYGELIQTRYQSFRNLLNQAGAFKDTSRMYLCNSHIKHLFSYFQRNCNPKMNLTFFKRYSLTKKILKDSNTLEALRFSKATTKQEKILNAVIKSKSVLICMAFSRILYFVQTHTPALFDKLK